MGFIKRFTNSVLILLSAVIQTSKSQEIADYANAYDYHLPRWEWWSSAKIGVDISPKVDFSIKMINRFGPDLQSWVGNYFYSQLRYNYKSKIYPDLQIRLVDGPSGKLWRYESGVQFRYYIGDYTLYWRTAYFNEYPYINRAYNPTLNAVNYWRNRIGLRKSISKRLKAEISFETYTQLFRDGMWIKRVATLCNLDYTLNKNSSINLFYMNQPDFHKSNQVWLSGLCIGYSYQLPDIIQKKKSKKDRQHFLEEEQ